MPAITANIIRIVGINGDDLIDNTPSLLYVKFNYDNYDPAAKVIARGVTMLDYTAGGPDLNPTLFATAPVAGMRHEFGLYAVHDIGGHDEVHGENSDDTIELQGGNDIAYTSVPTTRAARWTVSVSKCCRHR